MAEQAHLNIGDEQAAGRSRGGIERAKRLTPAERSRIAKQGARARWSGDVREAVCGSPDHPLKIGDIGIECYVLEDGTRVLTQRSFLQALGRTGSVMGRRGADAGLPPILRGKAIQPFISEETIAKSQPILFTLPHGGRASGYNALLLPEVCEIFLAAREAGVLPYQQQRVATQAEILVRGLARVGIVALVDEATGYQELRTKDALARILEAYIDQELNAWVSTFPADFYRELFRLRGLDYDSGSVKRPQYFGLLTNSVVYDRLAPGVLDELRIVVPKDEQGRRKHKFFQRLTTNVGYPKLREHLGSVVTLMKLSDDWTDFMAKLDRIHPRVGDTIPLPFDDDAGKGL